MTEQDRADFEKFIIESTNGLKSLKRDSVQYLDDDVQSAWAGFQFCAQLRDARKGEAVAEIYQSSDDLTCKLRFTKNFTYVASTANNDPIQLFTSPPLTYNDGLEAAAKVCDELSEAHSQLRNEDELHAYVAGGADACSEAIRALIQEEK